jgi:hypothetical protein
VRKAFVLASLAVLAVAMLAGCTRHHPVSPARNTVQPPATKQPTRSASATVSATVRCASAVLRIRAGRQGENEGAHGDIEFTNVGSGPCVLRGLPQVAIVRADGRSLSVRLVRAANLSLSPVVLPSGRLDAADLVVYWANWCGRPPGPLSVRVTLAAGGVITGPFNGPPDYNFVPDCLQHGQPSTVSVIDAYGPAG